MSTESQIRQLLDKGYSGSQIAKKLHLRKKTALNAIRNIQNKPINPKKVTNPKGRIGTVVLDRPSQAFTETLYKEGYPNEYIVKLVNAKHPETSKNRIKTYLKQYKTDNPKAEDSHKANMKFYKATGKYKQHLDAKYFRETKQHYYTKMNDRFKEGSPIIEVEIEEMEGKENEAI